MSYITTTLQPLKSYPTYQFYAEAQAEKLPPEDIFRICILETFRWLRARLKNFDNLPEVFSTPEPEDYAGFQVQPSFSFSDGLSIDVIYIEKEGIWSFLLTETDMGANLGTPRERLPVSGRMFSTEIAFRQQRNTVEIGVRTTCSEPAQSTADCEVFRPMVVKAMIENPLLILRHQQIPVSREPLRLTEKASLERFCQMMETEDFNFPVLLIADSPYETLPETEPEETPENKPLSFRFHTGYSLDVTPEKSWGLNLENLDVKAVPVKENDVRKIRKAMKEMKGQKPAKESAPKNTLLNAPAPVPQKLPSLDAENLAASLMGFAVVYFVDEKYFQQLERKTSVKLSAGDVVLLVHKTEAERWSYPQYSQDMKEFSYRLKAEIKQMPKRRSYFFGTLLFHSDARLRDYHLKRKQTYSLEEQCEFYRMSYEELKKQIKTYSQQNTDMQQLMETLRITQKQLKSAQEELAALKIFCDNQREQMQQKEAAYRRSAEIIAFYQERAELVRNFPRTQAEVCDWAEKYFSGQIQIASRAKSEMKKYSGSLDIDTLCDGIVYLNAYALFRRKEISEEQLSLYAAQNGWAVTGCGKEALRVREDAYKFTYQEKQYLMDMHIKHGIKSQTLIRIYFCWDDVSQKLLIGSMPEHLATVRQNT